MTLNLEELEALLDDTNDIWIDDTGCPVMFSRKNAHALVALRNAAPALIARVRELEEWQPIETAPKDGTEILLGWDLPAGFCYGLCYWGDDDEAGTRQDWIDSSQEWASHTKAPTHWKHLPKPPTP